MVQVKKKKSKVKKDDVKNKDESVELMKAGTSTSDDKSDLYHDEYSYKPSLTKVIFRAFGAYYLSANVIKFFHDCLLLITPYLLKYVQIIVCTSFCHCCCWLLILFCSTVYLDFFAKDKETFFG